MAGLACGEPNTVSFEILKNTAAFFASCPDWVSAKGMRILSSPLRGDTRVISGESGAVGLGLLTSLSDEDRRMLGIDENSTVLLFSTEGDTDPEQFRRIVWDGEFDSIHNSQFTIHN
jgi:diaminopropionate ammonia-lyase